MASRFIKFGQTPISEGVQELPLEIIAGKAQDIQKQSDQAIEGYLKTFSPLQPGYATTKQAEYINKLIQDESKALSEKLLDPNSGGLDAFKAGVIKANRKLQSDPNYGSVVADYKYRQDFEKQRKEDVEKGNIPLYIDPTSGQVKQADIGQTVNPAMYYSNVPFVDVNAKGNEIISKITPMLTEWANEDVTGVEIGDKGDYFAVTKSGARKKLDESVSHVKNALDAAPHELLNDTRTRNYFQEGINRGIIADYDPQGNLIGKAESYIKNVLFPKYRQYGQTDKVNYTKLGNTETNPDGSSKGVGIPNPFSLQSMGSDDSYESFQKTITNAKTNSDASWKNILKDVSLINPSFFPKIGIDPRKVLTKKDFDANVVKFIDYTNNTKDFSNLTPGEQVALSNLKGKALNYLADQNQVQFYTNQLITTVNNVYKRETGKEAPKSIIENIENGDYDLTEYIPKENRNGAYTKEGRRTINPATGKAISPFYQKIQEEFKNSGVLNLTDAYTLTDASTGGYSKFSQSVANNLWDNVNSKGLIFEGMDANADVGEGLAKLFKEKTGYAPIDKEGNPHKLIPKGIALDASGRIATLVEDSKTGVVASMIMPATVAYAPILKETYTKLAKSKDPKAASMATQGLVTNEMTLDGSLGNFNNFVNSNSNSSFNFKGIPIIKTIEKEPSTGQDITYYKIPTVDDKGRSTFITPTTPEDLKEILGKVLLNQK